MKHAALAKCSGLTDVTVHALVPPVIESFNLYPFEDCYDKATLHVPAEVLSDYQSHPFWSRFTHIEAFDPEAIHSVEAEAADAQGVFRVCGDRFDLQLNAESEVEVYDTAGRLVSSQRLAAGSHSITLPAQGVYVVKTK